VSVRVRFAPSPTGWLHVGGARTAYFNWLFARQHDGRFIVRIEDTDAERSTQASEAGVLDDLHWLGLDPDEGPAQGGGYGPYRQSERGDHYRAAAERLREAGKVYPCFCRDDELEARRKDALAAGRPPHYDGRCRSLSETARDAHRQEGRPESLRFIVQDHDWVLRDRVRGEVRFPAGMVGDFVLMRSNGLPTYNFAVTVDDAAMKISHVIRAEEHLANTPRQLMVYEALGATPPEFAHVPLILNRDRSKMSKREGEAAVAVGDWRRAGVVAPALLSYLALLGFHPGDDREILSREALLEAFTLDRVSKSGSIFDREKLDWVNRHYLHHASGEQLLEWVQAGSDVPPWVGAFRRLTASQPEATRARLLEVVRTGLSTLEDAPRELAAILEPPRLDDEARAVFSVSEAREVCAVLAEDLGGLAEWSAEAFKSAVQSAGKQVGVKGKGLFQPVRAALTGRTHGPELPLLAAAIGREACVQRLRAAATGKAGGQS